MRSYVSRAAGPIAALAIGCGAATPSRQDLESYLRWVAFEEPIANDRVLLRWPIQRMPLRIHLPAPPTDLVQRRFGVSRILITGRWNGGRVADLQDVYETVLHEMGHALGLAGHSPDARDIMFSSFTTRVVDGLSERDRATLAELYARPIGFRVIGARASR